MSEPLAPVWADASSASMRGRRLNNQDRVYSDATTLAVFDGVGGQAFGDVAARVGLSTLLAKIEMSRALGAVSLSEAMTDAGEAVRYVNDQIGFSAATTATAMVIDRSREEVHATLAWVGDSPAYLVRGNGVRELTTAHSELDDLRTVPIEYLTRWLGSSGASPQFHRLALRPADRLILVTDGISDVIDEPTLGGIVASAQTSAEAVHRILETALTLGSQDNISAAVMFLSTDQESAIRATGHIEDQPFEPLSVSRSLATRRG